MAIVMEAFSNSISDLSGYDYLAEFLYGGNGDMQSTPTHDVGTSSNQVVGYKTWNQNPGSALETGGIPTTVDLTQSSLTLSLSGSDPLSFSGTPFSSIRTVDIRVGVMSQAAVSWTGLQVQFYKDGVVTETVSVPGLSLDASGIAGGATEEMMARVIPSSFDNDAVRVLGSIDMAAPAGVFPADYDIFGQALFYQQQQPLLASSSPSNAVFSQTAAPVADSTDGSSDVLTSSILDTTTPGLFA